VTEQQLNPLLVTSVLTIENIAGEAVLVNALGQVDLTRRGRSMAQIRGCSRTVGHEGLEVGEDYDLGERVDFTFQNADTGLYVLWLRAKRDTSVEVYSDRSRDGTIETCTTRLGRVPLKRSTWYHIDVRFGAIPADDGCGVAFGTPTKAALPKRLAHLLQDGRR